jgi:hypothetical protein
VKVVVVASLSTALLQATSPTGRSWAPCGNQAGMSLLALYSRPVPMVSTSKCECCSWYLCGPSTDCSRSNFFSLTDEDDDVHYYVLMGTEGGNLTWHPCSVGSLERRRGDQTREWLCGRKNSDVRTACETYTDFLHQQLVQSRFWWCHRLRPTIRCNQLLGFQERAPRPVGLGQRGEQQLRH